MRDGIARLRGWLFVLRSRLLRRNVSIGPGLRIYRGFRVYGTGRIRIGANCWVCGVAGDPGQYVCLDTHAPDAVITIGDNALLCAARISARYRIVIGDNALIEEAGVVDTDFHSIGRGRGAPEGESLAVCGVTVGNHVGIGARSYITKGVTIGDGAVVLPGAVVTASVPPGAVVAGNPARPVAPHPGGPRA